MGKWLSRVIEKNESLEKKYQDIPKRHTDRTDEIPCSISGEGSEIVGFVPLVNENLTAIERKFYDDLMSLLTGAKYGLSREQAEIEARKTLARTRQVLQVQQAAKDYKRDGYVKIWSTFLKEPIYLVKDKSVRVPDPSISSYCQNEVETLKGLTIDEVKTLHEAKVIFKGSIGEEKNRGN